MMKKSWAHIMNSAAMELSLHESVQSIDLSKLGNYSAAMELSLHESVQSIDLSKLGNYSKTPTLTTWKPARSVFNNIRQSRKRTGAV